MTGAAFFDLDKTLLATSATLALGPQYVRAGIVSRSDAAWAAVHGAVYHRFGASSDAIERARDRASRVIAGLPVDAMDDVLDAWVDTIIPPLLYEEGLELVASHRRAGRPIVLASSSGTEVVTRISRLLGADHVIATVSEIEDGRYTGAVPFFAFAEGKATALRALAEAHGWDLAGSYAYSDSHTDLPMLEAVGHPHAVNPDRALRRVAEARGWPILAFRRTAAPRGRGAVPAAVAGPAQQAVRIVVGLGADAIDRGSHVPGDIARAARHVRDRIR